MPVTGYEGGEDADRERRVVEALRDSGVSVGKVHRVWIEEDSEGIPTEMALFISENGQPRTAQVWPGGEVSIEEGW